MKKYHLFSPKNLFHSCLALLLAAFFSLNIQAQSGPAKQWDKTFGGRNRDGFSSLDQTSDGGYIIGGFTDSPVSGDKTQPSNGGRDYWVIKLDANGKKTWDKTFGGSGKDRLTSLQQTSDGGYILGGESDSGISGDKSQASKGGDDFWVVKLDAKGNKTWDKTFGGSGTDWLISLQQTSDGGYILGGQTTSDIGGDKSQASKGGYDFWTVRLDASGNKLWDKTFGGSDTDLLYSLQQTSDGGYILGGYSLSGISSDKSQACQGSFDYWVVKLNANGNKTWDKTFGGHNYDGLTSLQQTSDGGYILGGLSKSGKTGDKTQALRGRWDYWVVKLDASGNKTWDKVFGGDNYDWLSSLQQTSDGGYILGGKSQSGISGDKTEASQGNWDYWVVKLDAKGNKTWDKTLGGNGHDALYSIKQTTDGGYILGGSSKSDISGDKSQASRGNYDCWVVKIDGNVTGLAGSVNSLARSVTGIYEADAGLAVSIYPNPSQGKCTLQINGISAFKAEVTVFDLLGRVVLQQELQVTDQRISQELTLPSAKGIYLIQLKAGEQTITRKIVVE